MARSDRAARGVGAPGWARRAATVATVALGCALPTVVAGGPLAPSAEAQTGAARLTLVRQDAWTPVGGTARLALTVEAPPPEARLSATVGQAVTTRTRFDEVVGGGPFGSVLNQVSLPLAQLPTELDGLVRLDLGLPAPTATRAPLELNVRRPGVYPLDLELRDADERPVASVRTMLVVAEADRPTVAQRLGVALVLPLTAPPSFLPDGTPDRAVAATYRPGGRLGRAAIALRSVPDVPVTLAPTVETLEGWATEARTDPSVAATFDALRAATPGRTVLEGPYVPVDLPSLLVDGQSAAADDVLARGAGRVGPLLATGTDPRTRVLRPASPAALARLRAAGVERVVVEGGALEPAPETRYTPAQPVVLGPTPGAPDAAPVGALVADPGLQALFARPASPAQTAQAILAGLALVALELPSQPRVVTIVLPDDLDAPGLVADLLAGLRDNPYLRPITVAEAFATVPADPPPVRANGAPGSSVRTVAAGAPERPLVSDATYRAQRSRWGAFATMTRAGDPAVAAGDRSLLAAVSDAWSEEAAPALVGGHLAVVDQSIGGLLERIDVPDPRTITLTARSGAIPLTFVNDTGHPVRLRASLSSDKLFFPQGSVLDLDLPPRSTTVRVAVEARTSGTFPVDLSVTSTDGVLPVSERRLEVRSTYVSTVGWVLMLSAAAVLAGWWGFDLRRRRRRRSAPS
jgi:hypothetical protein